MAARKTNNFTAEWRRKLSKAKLGERNTNYGGLSSQHRRAIAEAQMGSNNSFWKGGRSATNYSHYWSRISKRVRAEDKKCLDCGSVEDLVVHHKDFDRTHNKRDNLKTLCRPCHGRIHRLN